MTDNIKNALDYFHCEKENYNCAQAILKAFQKEFVITEQMIEEYKKFGGGRAPNNCCGALFAAMQLLADRPEKAALISAEFTKQITATTCKEIKAKKISCQACVKAADELLRK